METARLGRLLLSVVLDCCTWGSGVRGWGEAWACGKADWAGGAGERGPGGSLKEER